MWSMCPPALLVFGQACVVSWSVYRGWDCWWSRILVILALGPVSLLRSMRCKPSASKFAIEGIEGCSEQDGAGIEGLRKLDSGTMGNLGF